MKEFLVQDCGFDRRGDAKALEEWVIARCSGSSLNLGKKNFWPSSRWSTLPWPNVWMKREDELSFTLSGPKFRKFLSLSPILEAHSSILAVGSARSAFLLGLSQICRELKKPLDLILLESTPYQDFGTDVLYANAFQAYPQHWLKRAEWPEAIARARELLAKRPGALILPEGGVGPAALAGALSLPLDIVAQMQQLNVPLSEVWIDAGSGFTAQALILGLGTLLEDPPLVHVVLCAGDKPSFALGLKTMQSAAKQTSREASAPDLEPAPYQTHRPPTAKAYGATNRQVWDTIARFHQQEGILLDPLYTAKLIMAFEAYRALHPSDQGLATLIIHSGGGLNNFGFKEGLRVFEATTP